MRIVKKRKLVPILGWWSLKGTEASKMGKENCVENVLVQLISEKTPSTASSNKTSIGNTSLNVVVVQEEQRVQENHLQQNHIKVVYYILYHRAIWPRY